MALVAMSVMIAGVTLWALRDDNGGRVAAPPSTSLSAVARATSEVATESTATVASPGTVRADSGDAAPGHAGDSWYWLDLPGVVAKQTTLVQADPLPAGSSTRMWVSEDDSFSRVVVLQLFAGDPGFTTLAGTERTDVQSPMAPRTFWRTRPTLPKRMDPAGAATNSGGFALTAPSTNSLRSVSTRASWCASGSPSPSLPPRPDTSTSIPG